VLFFSEDDFRFYLEALATAASSENVVVHAYVLMTNHVHLLVTGEAPDGISNLMKRLGQCYVQRVNRTYGRTGSLWEGRFRSCLVQADNYLLACQRYIELNPVRAGMVNKPGDYRWSSFRANTGQAIDPMLTPHAVFLDLGAGAERRHSAYRELFDEHLDPAVVARIRESAHGGFVLGSERFQREIAFMLGRRTWKGSPGRPAKQTSDGTQQLLAL
jgi:putative transposase